MLEWAAVPPRRELPLRHHLSSVELVAGEPTAGGYDDFESFIEGAGLLAPDWEAEWEADDWIRLISHENKKSHRWLTKRRSQWINGWPARSSAM
jgi:hypothetical protein